MPLDKLRNVYKKQQAILCKYAAHYGLQHPLTIKKSEMVDRLVVELQIMISSFGRKTL